MNEQIQHFLKGHDTNKTQPIVGQNEAVGSLVKAPTSARWFNEQDWSRHRERISNMYTRDNLSVSMIQGAMQDQYGLNATAKMFKDRFKSWNLYKNLRSDEVLALLRIKAHRNAVGDSGQITFIRYGKPISEKRLERFLRDHPKIHERLRREPPDETLVDDLIESFLPSRGLIALSSPQRYLRDEEWSSITESTIYSLQTFHASASPWNISCTSKSIHLLREATWKGGEYSVMADSQTDRDSAWARIKKGHRLLEKDMEKIPDGFALDLLWLLCLIIEEGEVLRFGYQLARHISSLSERMLGAQSPYQAMFSGLVKLMEDSLSTGGSGFKHFYIRVSEALIDIVVSRVHSGRTDGTCNETFPTMHRIVGSPRKEILKAALQSAAQKSTSHRTFTIVAGTLARIHERDGEYMAAHALCKRITDNCTDTCRSVFHTFQSLRSCVIPGDWSEFERVATFLEAGLENVMRGGDILFHTHLNAYIKFCAALKKVLLFIKDNDKREDQQEAHRALMWLERVGRAVANPHEIARGSATQ